MNSKSDTFTLSFIFLICDFTRFQTKEPKRRQNDSSDQKKFLLIVPYGYTWKQNLKQSINLSTSPRKEIQTYSRLGK